MEEALYVANFMWAQAQTERGRDGMRLEEEAKLMEVVEYESSSDGLIWQARALANFGAARSVAVEFPKEYLLHRIATLLLASKDYHEFTDRVALCTGEQRQMITWETCLGNVLCVPVKRVNGKLVIKNGTWVRENEDWVFKEE